MTSLREINNVADSADQLYDEEQVKFALERVAREIVEQTHGEELLVQCVMNGGLITTALLVPHISNLMRVDYIHASRYRDQTHGGDLDWRVGPSLDVKGRAVLIVDDIFDEGHTLKAVCDYCRDEGAASVRSAVLVDKVHNRKVGGFTPDFVGLRVPDRYVFGSGMDYKGYLRNLPGIFAVADT